MSKDLNRDGNVTVLVFNIVLNWPASSTLFVHRQYGRLCRDTPFSDIEMPYCLCHCDIKFSNLCGTRNGRQYAFGLAVNVGDAVVEKCDCGLNEGSEQGLGGTLA